MARYAKNGDFNILYPTRRKMANILKRIIRNDGIEYIITGPIEVISDTQLHVETDKGIILVDDTMEIYYELK